VIAAADEPITTIAGAGNPVVAIPGRPHAVPRHATIRVGADVPVAARPGHHGSEAASRRGIATVARARIPVVAADGWVEAGSRRGLAAVLRAGVGVVARRLAPDAREAPPDIDARFPRRAEAFVVARIAIMQLRAAARAGSVAGVGLGAGIGVIARRTRSKGYALAHLAAVTGLPGGAAVPVVAGGPKRKRGVLTEAELSRCAGVRGAWIPVVTAKRRVPAGAEVGVAGVDRASVQVVTGRARQLLREGRRRRRREEQREHQNREQNSPSIARKILHDTSPSLEIVPQTPYRYPACYFST